MSGARPGGSAGEARLLALWRRLDRERRATLVEFAEFLAARGEAPRSAQVATLRPQHETVVHAVRRLNASFPMLGRVRLLQPVGDLLSQHLVDGRDATAVIDDLEALYAAAYAAFLKAQ
ncbi:MAG: hypothetical protein U1F45_16830 [Burkholderiales bacterium]